MICWWCGNRLTDPFGREVEGELVNVDGLERRVHKICAADARAHFSRITAQPSDKPPRIPKE